MRLSGKYGYLGIDIFFVISGFILTHVLLRSNYSLKSFHEFIAHRLIRLKPPYLASIVIVLNFLAEATLYYRGEEVVLDIGQIFVLLVALLASIVAAEFLYRFVEKPAITLAKRTAYSYKNYFFNQD